MRTDPRRACANAQERKLYAFLHDALAHPLMALTGWCGLSIRFHDWTSAHAWPRAKPSKLHAAVRVRTVHWGTLIAMEIAPAVWEVHHPRVQHSLRVTADDAIEATSQAETWFDDLAKEFAEMQPNFARVS
jgi:hypothetical protein